MDRRELVESLTKSVFEQMDKKQMTPDQRAEVAEQCAGGRVYCGAAMSRLFELQDKAGVAGISLGAEAVTTVIKDGELDRLVGEAVEDCTKALEVMRDVGHREAEVAAVRLRLAQESIGKSNYKDAVHQMRALLDMCQNAADGWGL